MPTQTSRVNVFLINLGQLYTDEFVNIRLAHLDLKVVKETLRLLNVTTMICLATIDEQLKILCLGK